MNEAWNGQDEKRGKVGENLAALLACQDLTVEAVGAKNSPRQAEHCEAHAVSDKAIRVPGPFEPFPLP